MQYWDQGVPARYAGSIRVLMDNVLYETAASSAEFGIHYHVGKIYDVSNVSQFSFAIFGNDSDGEIAGAGANGIYAIK